MNRTVVVHRGARLAGAAWAAALGGLPVTVTGPAPQEWVTVCVEDTE